MEARSRPDSEARSHVRNALQAFQSVAQLSFGMATLVGRMRNPFAYILQDRVQCMQSNRVVYPPEV